MTNEWRDPFTEIKARRIGEWKNLLVTSPDCSKSGHSN